MEAGLFDVITAVDVGMNLVSVSKILERLQRETFAHRVNSGLSRSSSVENLRYLWATLMVNQRKTASIRRDGVRDSSTF